MRELLKLTLARTFRGVVKENLIDILKILPKTSMFNKQKGREIPVDGDHGNITFVLNGGKFLDTGNRHKKLFSNPNR